MYLVDTNVLSAEAPTKAVAAPDLVAWMDRNSAGLTLSVISVAEMEDGIAKSRRLGVPRKAERLSDWLETLLHLYGSRVLPIDVETARRVGAFADRARSQGLAPGLADLAIAAYLGSSFRSADDAPKLRLNDRIAVNVSGEVRDARRAWRT